MLQRCSHLQVMKSLRRISRLPLSAVGLMVFSFIILLSGCQNEKITKEVETPSPLQLEAIQLQHQHWRESIDSYGRFESAEKVTISVDFSGSVETVNFGDGGRVSAGQLLIKLNESKQKLRLKQAQANQASLHASFEKTKSTLQRHRELETTHALSNEQLKISEANFKSAAASLRQAVAAQELAQQDLADTRIVSPVDGVVDQRSVEPGQTVLPGQQLAVVQVTDTLRVVTYVTQKEVNSLRVGDEAPVRSPGVPEKTYLARIESIASSAEPDTGNFQLKLTVANPDQRLRVGMTASIKLQGTRIEKQLLVPRSAVIDRHGKKIVFLVRDGVAKEVEPVFKLVQGDWLPVLAGVDVGDLLIIDHLDLLSEGTPVNPVVKRQAQNNGAVL